MASPLTILYRLLSVLLALAGGSLSGLLLAVSQSSTATLFGTAALILSLIPLLHWITQRLRVDFLSYLTLLAFVIAILLAGWLLFTAPDGRPAATARVQNRYAGKWAYPRNSFGNLLPELDQLRLGLKLAPLADKVLTWPQADHLADLTTGIYRELEADADFRSLGTVLPHAYDDLWFGPSTHGHYFLYIPEKVDRKKPAPLLVFLHGSAGNFKAYTWLLAQVADELGMVVAAPSFGMGEWHEPKASEAIAAMFKDLSTVVSIDESRRHLMGLSNGGLGVCRVGSHFKDTFSSCIFISPVMDLKIPALYPERWHSLPVLILTGAADDRVPLKYVQDAAAQFRKFGSRVTLATFPHADHFLLFSHREQALQQITGWLRRAPRR